MLIKGSGTIITFVVFGYAYEYNCAEKTAWVLQMMHENVFFLNRSFDVDDIDSYLIHQPEISDLFKRLSAAGKKLFVITNSGFHFV